MDKVAERLSVIAMFLLIVGLCCFCEAAAMGRTSAGPAEEVFVEEWEKMSAAEVNLAVMSKEQVFAEVQKGLEAQKALSSWESRYQVTWQQHSIYDSVPEVVTKGQTRIVSDGNQWIFEGKEDHEYVGSGGNQTQHYRYACNGRTITMLWPDDKTAQVKDAQEVTRISGIPSILDFMSWLPTVSCLRQNPGFPEVLDILGAADTELLPWYTRVDGYACYVLERTEMLRQPIFRSIEELEKWKIENPEKTKAWSKAARYGLVFNIYPRGQPGGGDTRVVEVKFRLAIAPELGFAIVRWAYGHGAQTGPYRAFIFPDSEIKYGDFRKVGKDLFIPHQMVYTEYGIDRHAQRSISKETQLAVEQFAVNEQYQPELFEFDIPNGYRIIDSDRGIVYTKGDSPEKIEVLLAGAKARDEFYKKLSEGPAPSLKPARWFNSEPIRLSEQTGREVILHFWSLGCPPCVAELAELQKQYAQNAEQKTGPLFVSIHPFVEGTDLEQLKELIGKHSVTFPVMVDAGPMGPPFWGKTFKKYMVMAVPTDIKIDEQGHVGEMEKDLVSERSWWVKSLSK